MLIADASSTLPCVALSALACSVPAPSTEAGTTPTTTQSSTDTASETTDESSTQASETETGELECGDAYIDCRAEHMSTYEACVADCEAPDTCAGVACTWPCEGARELGLEACAQQHCPDNFSDWDYCEAECRQQVGGDCPQTPDCELDDCEFAEMICVVANCHPCETVDFEYAWVGSCDIQLPGTAPESKRAFATIEVHEPDYDAWQLSESPEDCADPNIGGIWATPDYDAISLCPDACAAFETAGQLIVEFGSPPCE